jgi:hypothetical protein
MSFLEVEQRRGDPETLDGRLTVYARVDIDPSDLIGSQHPIASMVHNGFLVAQGNYREQNNLRDFLKSEMGLSLEDGLSEFLDKLDGLEAALDPDKLKEKMSNIDDIQDFIPTPAKIVPFHSEDEILSQEGDVFCTGAFRNMANANLSVNSFPIIYQARFREQQMERVRNEIEMLVSQVELDETPEEHFTNPGIDASGKILKEYIPQMLYCRREGEALQAVERRFRSFLKGYRFPEDVERVVNLIRVQGDLGRDHYRLLELYAKKIGEVGKENFTEVDAIQQQIRELEEQVSEQ